MFAVTYLGARTWLVQSGDDVLLIDPLFGDRFATRGGTTGYKVFPPRKLALAGLPPLSAVVLTSESPMHFDLESLRQLPRGTPVLVANNVSAAATTVLQEMGFLVRCAGPGEETTFGDLRVMFLCPHKDSLGMRPHLERCAISVRETTGEGHFCQSPSGGHDVAMWWDAWTLVPRPGIWVFDVGDNHSNSRTWTTPTYDSSGTMAREFLARHEEIAEYWQAPRAYVACGPGFAYDGALASLNHSAFPVEPSTLCQALHATLAPQTRISHLLPGMGMRLRPDGALETFTDNDLVRAAPQAAWPSTGFALRTPQLPMFPPFCGETYIDHAGVDQLTARLTGLARALTLLGLARDLLSLRLAPGDRRRRAAALILRIGERNGSAVLEYDPQQCCFVESDANDPFDEYPLGLELWASDLLLTLSGACHAEFIERGHGRAWNTLPALLRWSLVDMIRMCTQPLMLPSEHLQSYRAQLRQPARD